MKRWILAVCLAGAAWGAKDYVMRPEEQEVIYPKLTFNPEESRQALAQGTCSLRGSAFERASRGFLQADKPHQYPPQGSKIYLFPYTPYTREVVHLFKEYDPVRTEKSTETLMAEAELKSLTGRGIPEILPRKRPDVHPEFPKIWKSAKVGPKGQFAFEGLKPGRYYLQSMTYMVGRDISGHRQVGEETQETYWSTGDTTYETRPIWAEKSTTMYHKVELVAVVDLTAGENRSIELDEDWKNFDAP
ncbi:MAG: hypothetical protein J0I12_31835 [Candidatus Eremiobacteraeota bacterium]|nr:hypothetical protein [Candidatus Eremiobacteraeota bacterium]